METMKNKTIKIEQTPTGAGILQTLLQEESKRENSMLYTWNMTEEYNGTVYTFYITVKKPENIFSLGYIFAERVNNF